MPAATKVPATKILDRELSRAITREVCRVAAPALREVVDEGIRVFQRCSATARGTDEHIGLLFPFLQLTELLDGTDVLLEGGAVVPARLVLRGAFEALLTVEWVARDHPLRYGAAYVVVDIHQRIAGCEQYSQAHPRRDQLLAAIRSDEFGGHVKIPTIKNAAEKAAAYRALLDAPHLRDAATEYERTRKKLSNPPFYSLWDGPRNIEQLAHRLARAGHYEILYRSWSRTAHAEDVMRQLGEVEGEAAVRPFRSGEGLSTAYTFALSFGLAAIRSVLGFYRPEELKTSFAIWYKKQISGPFKRVSAAGE